MKLVQSQSKHRDDKLTKLNDQQTKTTTELAQFRTHKVNKRAKTTKSKSAASDCEQPAKLAKIAHGDESFSGAPSTVAYSALLAERDELNKRFEALMLEYQCIPVLAEKAKQLCAKVVDFENTSTLERPLL